MKKIIKNIDVLIVFIVLVFFTLLGLYFIVEGIITSNTFHIAMGIGTFLAGGTFMTIMIAEDLKNLNK